MINAKGKGARNELKCRDFFVDRGYLVTKAGGSLGVFDIIAINNSEVLLIQVKSNRRIPRHERNVLDEVLLTKLDRQITRGRVEILEWVWYDREGYRVWSGWPKDDKIVWEESTEEYVNMPKEEG